MPPFEAPTKVETAYRSEIAKIISRFLPKRFTTVDMFLKHLGDLSERADLIEMATSLADRMVRWVNVENIKSWKQAAEESQRGPMLYGLLKKELEGSVGKRFDELVEKQASYITDIPSEVASRLAKSLAVHQQQGLRPEALVHLLSSQFPALTTSRIQLLARTGVSSSSTLLTEARCEELDLPWFRWYTSKDRRVRPSHQNMDGVLVAWNDLPSPEALIGLKPSLGHYAPGNCPNCRCGPLPILTLEDVFPRGGERVRVYHAGSIRTMSKSQFAKLSKIESREAA